MVGGPLADNKLISKDVLEAFTNINIDFENEGGLYVLNGVCRGDLVILFSGTDGYTNVRETLNSLVKKGRDHDEAECENISKILLGDNCYRRQT